MEIPMSNKSTLVLSLLVLFAGIAPAAAAQAAPIPLIGVGALASAATAGAFVAARFFSKR
jgi:hypothetical protein